MAFSTLPGNPHHAAANNGEAEVDPYIQAQAILALAYEQRTANLIALLADASSNGELAAVGSATLIHQITERLGL